MPRRLRYHDPFDPFGSDPGRRDYESSDLRRADKRFYASARWLKLRALKLAENPLCEECETKGRVEAAAHVHHVQGRKKRPDLDLDYDNLQSLCHRCHSEKTGRGE